jgi:hypothetical protein
MGVMRLGFVHLRVIFYIIRELNDRFTRCSLKPEIMSA